MDELERILSRTNLLTAWKQVKSNKGSAGVDGVTIDDFPAYLRQHWPEIKLKLLDGTYEPSPVKRGEIPKRSGGKRQLGIPTVLDRLIQQAILQVLQPIFDLGFSESSYGFRPHRSAHQAIRKVRQTIDEGYKQIVDVDLSKFFDRVNHDLLMARISRKVKDKRVLRLIGRYLRCGVQVDGKVLPTTEGVPQGGPLSPLLANIMLDDFDKELEQRCHRFVRYADDFMIFVKSKRAAQRVLQSVTRWLEKNLKLVINREKLSDYIRGWMNYFALSEYYRPLPGLDEWIRRRVSACGGCYMKQWRRPRTRIRNLISLGAVKEQAIGVGLSSKGPWKLAKTFGSQSGLTNACLKEQGLVSMRDLWIAFHYPK